MLCNNIILIIRVISFIIIIEYMQNGVIKMIMLYLKYKKESIIQLISMYIVFFLVIWLYNLPYYNAFIFAMELYGVIYVTYMIYDYCRFVRKYRILEENLKVKDMQSLNLPQKENVIDGMYGRIIKELLEQKKRQFDAALISGKNLKDYYACWAHQIKTPIAAVKLMLQSMREDEENTNNRSEKLSKINQEMFKIEFYTDAVMNYLRLEDISSDYEFKECRLDTVIKKSVKRFAPQFIGRHISLHLEEINDTICTDAKWLGFIIEQLISNAIKYNNDGGSVRVYTIHKNSALEENVNGDGNFGKLLRNDNTIQLIIEDTGIGISPEDIPRIMERGFTGYNGRLDKKSSGIGLYLCKKAADRLGFVISFDSEYKAGARAVISMTQLYTKHE